MSTTPTRNRDTSTSPTTTSPTTTRDGPQARRDGPKRRTPGRWARASGYLAALWAAVYGAVALVWTLTGSGYPFGENDAGRVGLLADLPVDVGAPLFAGVLLATAVLALAVAGDHAVRLHGPARWPLLVFGWGVAAALLVVVPDERLLTLAGYTPMLVLGAPFGWPPVDYSEVFTWTLLNQAWSVAGGVLLARALLTWQLRTARPGDWTSPAAAARWGRWAAYVAAAVPALYAATRFAWVLGIPLGVSEEFVDAMHDSGMVWAGAGLGAFAVVGAVLTLGLFQRWGEVFPRWMLGLSGRRVPIMLAVVPATLVAIMVASASLGFLSKPEILEMALDGETTVLPMLLWPLWSVALGAATLAYYLRRIGRGAVAA